jgi:protein-tyrosine-phosphatase
MKKGTKRLLFVCYGNICRSPMAEALARQRLGPAVEVASAGIGAAGGPATEEAILVMKVVYKIDISSHVARPVGIFDLKSFDYIVAMDVSVYNSLRDIEDPIGQDYQTYKETALKIERRLGQFLASVGLEA